MPANMSKAKEKTRKCYIWLGQIAISTKFINGFKDRKIDMNRKKSKSERKIDECM